MRRLLPLILLALTLAAPPAGAQSLGVMGTALESAPPFVVRSLEGQTLRLVQMRGRPVIVDFWATWCAPCRASLPHLNSMHDRFRSRGLVVLGLSVDDDAAMVKRFVRRTSLRFPVAMAGEQVLDSYGPIRSIPTTFFIDRGGQVVRRVVGYVDEETLEQYVREILP